MSVTLFKTWQIVREREFNGGLKDGAWWTLRVSNEGTAEEEPEWCEYELRDGPELVERIVKHIVKRLDEELA